MCWNQVYFYCICDRVESTYRVIVHCSSLHVSYKFYLNYLWFYLWRRGKYLMVLCCSLMSYIIMRCVYIYIYMYYLWVYLWQIENYLMLHCTLHFSYNVLLYNICTIYHLTVSFVPMYMYTDMLYLGFFTCDRRAITWWHTVVLYMSYSIYCVYMHI